MDSWTMNILLIEGLPLLGFVYYLEYKRRMYLLEKFGPKGESPSSPREKKLAKGLFLILAGSALIFIPGIASVLGQAAELNFEMLLIGVIIICAGLAILASSNIFGIRGLSGTDGYEMK